MNFSSSFSSSRNSCISFCNRIYCWSCWFYLWSYCSIVLWILSSSTRFLLIFFVFSTCNGKCCCWCFVIFSLNCSYLVAFFNRIFLNNNFPSTIFFYCRFSCWITIVFCFFDFNFDFGTFYSSSSDFCLTFYNRVYWWSFWYILIFSNCDVGSCCWSCLILVFNFYSYFNNFVFV